MNASASPGRTWIIFAAQCRMPVLAPASPTAILHGGFGFARLSGMGGAPPSTVTAHPGHKDNPRSQLSVEHDLDRWVGRCVDSLSIDSFGLLGCG
jgi:hypothetical protein